MMNDPSEAKHTVMPLAADQTPRQTIGTYHAMASLGAGVTSGLVTCILLQVRVILLTSMISQAMYLAPSFSSYLFMLTLVGLNS